MGCKLGYDCNGRGSDCDGAEHYACRGIARMQAQESERERREYKARMDAEYRDVVDRAEAREARKCKSGPVPFAAGKMGVSDGRTIADTWVK